MKSFIYNMFLYKYTFLDFNCFLVKPFWWERDKIITVPNAILHNSLNKSLSFDDKISESLYKSN